MAVTVRQNSTGDISPCRGENFQTATYRRATYLIKFHFVKYRTSNPSLTKSLPKKEKIDKLSNNAENTRLEYYGCCTKSLVQRLVFTEDFVDCLMQCQRDLHINVNVFVFPCQKFVIRKFQFISYLLLVTFQILCV